MKKKYVSKAKVWLYPGMAGWHFIHVDKKHAKELREKHSTKKRGFGSIPVEVTIGKTSWKTSIFPDKRSGTYLLPLKQHVRLKEKVFRDDTITFTIVPR